MTQPGLEEGDVMPGGEVLVVGMVAQVLRSHLAYLPTHGDTHANASHRWIAGPAVTQAISAQHQDVQVTVCTAVADDAVGREMTVAMQELPLTSHVSVVTAPHSDTVLELVSAEGLRRVITEPAWSSWQGSEALWAALDALTAADVVVLDGTAHQQIVRRVLATAVHREVRVILTLPRYATLPESAYDLADPLVVDETVALQAADAGWPPASLLVLFGTGGAAWSTQQYVAPTRPTWDAGEDSGCRDAFIGALAGALAHGEGRDAAVAQGLEASVQMVGVEGPVPGGHQVGLGAPPW